MKKNKFFLALMGAILLSANALAGGPLYDENGFAINPENPNQYQEPTVTDGVYQIANAGNLYWFADFVNQGGTNASANAVLISDITVNENLLSSLKKDEDGNVTNGSDFKAWTPIGNSDVYYTGTFDGNGHTIRRLYFNDESTEYVGLFGYIDESAKVQNVGVVDSYFKGYQYDGGVVGYNKGTVSNVYNTGAVSGETFVGGVVGYNDGGTVSNAYNTGSVSGSGDYVGGVVGANYGTVSNAYNTGSVSGSGDNVGGVVGYSFNGTVSNVYNTGSVSGNGVGVGGVVGNNYGTVSNVYNTGSVNGTGGYVGGVGGYNDGGTVSNGFFNTEVTCENCDVVEGTTGMSSGEFADGTVARLLHDGCEMDGGLNGSIWGQDLTAENSLPDFSGKITGTLYLLTLVTFDEDSRTYPTEYMKELGLELPTDLVREGYVFAGWSTKQVSTSMADIVTSIAKGATGAKTFYAQWMKVSEEGVYEIATAVDLYKFAQLVNGGAIDIKGKLTADICVNACGEGESVLNADGSLNGDGSNFTPWTPIGTSAQKFIGTFDGAGHTISGLYVDGAEYAGLFGYVFVDNINGEDEKGVVKNVGIEDSYISGIKYVGGVVAYNEGRTLSVYNAGNVTGSGSGCATGGVVGYNVGLVSDAYNAGTVKSSVNDCSTGGVVGLNAGFVFYVYNIGAVSGGANVGGVAGSNSSMISKAYYNTEVFTGNAVGSGNLPNPVAGKTVAQLSSLEIVDLVSDKDHVGSSAWVVGSGRVVMSDNKLVYKLPGLKGFSTQPEIVLMQANDQNVFEIGSAQELKGFAEYAGSGAISINAKLTADICLNACGAGESVLDANGSLNGDDANFEQWTPINIASMNTNMSLDGNGHTISGLYFRNADKDSVGFFGSLQGTVSISNLGIEDSYIEGKDNVGVFVGVNDNSNLTITNCFGAGYVKGNGYVAGFVGQSKGGLNIANSYSVSIVNGEDYTGGFIGSGALANVANSFFLNGVSNVGGTQKSADEFHDGTVAVLLHNWCEKDDGSENCKEGGLDGTVWGQDLTNANSLPDFSSKVGTPYSLTLHTFDGDTRKYQTEYVSEMGLELPTDLTRETHVFLGWSTKETAESSADIVTSIAKGETSEMEFYAQWMKVNSEQVFEIASKENLYEFAKWTNMGFVIDAKLVADICLNACGEGKSVLNADGSLNGDGSEFTQWIPIGTETQKFNGTFDGAGHTISGLYFNQDKSNAGLFGRSTKGGSIKNVGVVDSYIKGKNNVGGIVGHNGNCKVSNVFSTSTVQGNEYVGGIAGYNDAGTIENAYNMGALSGNSKVAGIAGYNLGTSAHINNVYSSGTVSGPKDQYVRGLVGYNSDYTKNIKNAFYNTDVFSGKAVGNVDGTNVEGKTTVELASTTLPEGFSSEIWLAGSKNVVDGKLVYKFPGLKIFNSQPEVVLFNVQKGSDGKDYCEIANADDLFKFAQLVNGGATGLNAKLMADICVNACGEGEKSLLEQIAELEAKDELSSESFQQWTPMSVPANVTVAFDGNGHTISGLYINKDKSSQIGLFGQVVGDVSVSNLGVVDFYVNGNGEVGSLAGQVTGKLNIKNCYSAGSVKGVFYVGGIVGVNRDNAELKIENSYNESSVNAPSGIVGGFVGENYNYASLTITNSYNAGAVSGEDIVGGLVGDNYTYAILTIENSYNAGTASGDSCVGGLVGVNEDGTLNVSNSYNVGIVTASKDIAGGLVGGNEFGTLNVSNSYNVGIVTASKDIAGGLVGGNEFGILNVSNSFFVETNGDGDGLAGEAKTSDEFANGTVTDLLNTGQSPVVWVQGKEYPILKDNHIHSYENGFCACGNLVQPVQDENGVYQISNAGELYWFADFVNNFDNAEEGNRIYYTKANAFLVNDIVVNENLLSLLEKDVDGNVTNGDAFKAWNPMGYYINYGNNVYYAGTFDGNGHTISGLYFNDSSRELVGLFGLTTEGASIKNLGVVDSYFKGGSSVGGVCGMNNDTLTNCYNTGEVNGSGSRVGGVCGYSHGGTLTNCYNTGEVNGEYYVGGVCGENMGPITNCYNTGVVNGSGSSVGGVCGYKEGGTITNCYNTGEVNGEYYVGGVCGENSGPITNCYNTGEVNGSGDNVGGVCGNNGWGTITNCYYLETSANTGIGEGDGEATAKTATQFADGTVAKLLFASDTIWGQNTSTDTVPNFSGKIIFTVSVTASDNGTVSGASGEYEYNSKLAIVATANTGYHFVEWSSGSTKINDTILVVSDTALVATFEAHSFGNWDTTSVATCTTLGMRSHICSCGVFEDDTIDVLPHAIVIDTLIPATCTHWGLKEGLHCSVCKTVLVKQDTIEALGHKVVTDAAVTAICTHFGLKEGSHCSVCKTVLVKQDTIEALGHSFTLYVYNDDATTETDGTKTAACDHEGCDETDTQVAVGTKLEPTLSEKTEGDKFSIYTFGRSIVIENADADINVYDVTGRLVARRVGVHSVSERIEVPNIGVYVVKCGNMVKRVSVIQ